MIIMLLLKEVKATTSAQTVKTEILSINKNIDSIANYMK